MYWVQKLLLPGRELGWVHVLGPEALRQWRDARDVFPPRWHGARRLARLDGCLGGRVPPELDDRVQHAHIGVPEECQLAPLVHLAQHVRSAGISTAT